MKIKLSLLFCLLSGSVFALPIEIPELTGVMRCVPVANIGADYYDMYACKSSDGTLTISEFFEKYKRNKGDKITKVIYDSYQNLFHIYYEKSIVSAQDNS